MGPVLYGVVALGFAALLTAWEIGRHPGGRRTRLQARLRRQARRMEHTKRTLARLPPLDPEVANKPPPKGRRY